MHKMITTQLGGKFSKEDLGLFDLKLRLVSAGISVAYPQGNGILATQNGVDLSFDPTKTTKSFYDIELDLFKMIKENQVHILHNKFKLDFGYVGRGASVEMAYAMSHDRPIILLYEPQMSSRVPPEIMKIVSPRLNGVNIKRLDQLCATGLKQFVESIAGMPTHYGVTVEEEYTLMQCVSSLLASYKTKLI